MPALRLFLCLALLSLTACSDPRSAVLSRLRGVKVEDVRREVAQLHAQYFASPGPEFIPIRPEFWPATIVSLRPSRMTLYRDGLAITLQDRPGFEYGIHVVPPGDIMPPRSTKITRYELLQEGIYFFTQER